MIYAEWKLAALAILPVNDGEQFVKDCYVMDHALMVQVPGKLRIECAFGVPFGS